jgi:lipid-A-disaccharide synthase
VKRDDAKSAPTKMTATPLIAMVAGEASGDTLGAHLMVALRQHIPQARFVGIGGPKMIGQGFESWFAQERLAVRGLVEVIRHLPELLRIRRQLVARLIAEKPVAYIGIDAPDFNLGIEARIRKKGIRTVHYVSPTVWAWRPGRIKRIGAAASHMLVLFPFEESYYQAAGIPDEIPESLPMAAARAELRVKGDAPVVAVLPGSRQSEIQFMAPPFIEACNKIFKTRPATRFLIPFATRESRELFESILAQCADPELPVTLLFGHAHEAMAAADVVLVTSGTASLEAALVKRPMVIAYRVTALTNAIARRMLQIPYLGLPNILAGKFIVPEFLQEDCTPDNLAQAVLNALDDRSFHPTLIRSFEAMHRSLRQNTAARAAQALLPLLGADRA